MRLSIFALAAALAAACSERPHPNDRPTIRLSPLEVAFAGPSGGRLVDRDTTTAVPIAAGPTAVTLRFGHRVEMRRVKVHGRNVTVSLDGLAMGDADDAGWASGTLSRAITADAVTLTLSPRSPDAEVAEIEVWGAGRDQAPRDALAVALRTEDPSSPPYEDVWTLRASDPSASLQPAGAGSGDRCARTRFPASDPRQARRAYLAYEANVVRSVVLQHSFNGDAPVNGTWIGATGTRRTIIDEIDPERLRGADEIVLCLPTEAGGAVDVSGLRLLLFLDDGVHPFDRDIERTLSAAVDGSADTALDLAAGATEFELQRPVDIERAELRLGRVPATLQKASILDRGSWRDGAPAELSQPVTALDMSGRASAVRLDMLATGNAAAAANVAELAITGSGVGPRVATPRIVITYPALQRRDGRDVGERFGNRAFVSGWAESPAGAGSVEVDGADVGVKGAFSTPLERATAPDDGWPVTLRARFPDGTEVLRTIHLDDDRESDLLSSGEPLASADQRFGRLNETGWGTIDPDAGGRARLGTGASVEVPAGAVSAKTTVGITRKDHAVMPRLDAGMVNVTAPPHAAYRFSPKGQKFAKPVKVTLPYDPSLLPDGVAPEEIQTWYFDEGLDRWLTLPRREIRRDTGQIVSETTHFTFMINAVLVLPDHPGPAAFNPTSIKDLKAADPSAGIDLIEPPVGNTEGTARVSFPFRLPKARGAYQPSIALEYDSASGNGWTGVGWDVRVPRIQIDGRYGVPEYSGDERYLLGGEQLVPVDPAPYGTGTTCTDGTPGRAYRARVERQFRKVVRCGSDPTRYWFEVTEKTGVLFVYGNTENGRLTSYVPRITDPPMFPPVYDVAEWCLQRVIDLNGNLTEYAYQHDSRDADDAVHREDFRQIYLGSIRYTGSLAPRTGSGALDGGISGPYEVELRHVPGARADVITSARNGFKTVTRRRLGAIEVKQLSGFPSGTIRTYQLSYERGDFGKSRLHSVAVLGTDGRRFYSHTFEYENKAPDRDGVELFGPPVPWLMEDGYGLSATQEWSAGFHGFVGLGLGFLKSAGAIGVGFGYNRRHSDTNASFVDLNGDGLPDRVYGTGPGNAILFNQGAGHALASQAPPGDPGAGQDVTLLFSTDGKSLGLGSENSRSFDIGLQVFGGPLSLNFGATYGLTKSTDFMLDANGDGLPDIVNGGKVFFNQPRHAECPPGSTSDECCRATGFCFRASYPMQALEDLAESSKLLSTDATVADANADLAKSLTPEDAVVEWTAPYAGRVDVSGTFAFVNAPAAGGRTDGVRLRVYRYNPFDPVPLPLLISTIVKPPGDDTVSDLAIPDIEVTNGEILYFVVSTLSDFPTRGADGKPSPVEQVKLRPVVAYTGIPASLRHVRDSTGAPAFRFDAASDYAFAGDPESSMAMPRAGDVRFELKMAKAATNDWVRACIKYYGPKDEHPSNARCSTTDFYYRVFEPAEVYSDTTPLAVTVDRPSTEAGGVFYVRLETDLAVDPHAVRWDVSGRMTCVNTKHHGCVAPQTDDEAKSLSFKAVPHFQLHAAVVNQATWRPAGTLSPMFIAPVDGTISVHSVAAFASRATPIHFAVRTTDRVLKWTGDHSANGSLELKKGDAVFFDAHTESAASLDLLQYSRPSLRPDRLWASACTGVSGWPLDRDWDTWDWYGWNWTLVRCRPVWQTSCVFNGADGVARSCPSGLQPIGTDRVVEGFSDGNGPVLAGGHHGWRYGAWQGRDEEPFQPWVFRSPAKDGQDEWAGAADDVRKRQKDKMKNEEDPKRIRLRLLGLPVPSATGTRLQPDEPGLSPDHPAFVTQDGNTFFTVSADTGDLFVHAGKKGENSSNAARGPDGVTVVPLEFQIGDIARTSTFVSRSAGVGVGVPGLSISGSMSTGISQQKLEVLDMNGDGIIDVVASGGIPSTAGLGAEGLAALVDGGVYSHVRVTSPVTLATSRVVRMPGVPLLTYDVSGQIGLGASDPGHEFTALGETRGFTSRMPNMSGGAGVGYNVGTTVQQLVDINGDGLLDSVRRSGSACASGFSVRLNMGTSFAAAEDCVEASAAAFPPDPTASAAAPGGDTTDSDTSAATDAAARLLGMGAVRKTSTITLQGTAGIGADFESFPLGGEVDESESYGAAVTLESSLTATNLALVDVTGDGLPDYVYKSNQGDDFIVRVNLGYGFAPPRIWHPAAGWLAGSGWRGAAAAVGQPIPPQLHVAPGSGPGAALVSAFLPDLTQGIDPIEATGSHSAAPSVSVAFNFAFPLLGLPTPPWIHIGGGLSHSPSKVAGFELGLQDIDGDGLPDHVLKTGDNKPVWARLNQLGKANLLKRIVRPLGGSVDLAYDHRAGNTVDMPESRWVLSRVVAHDGRGSPGELGHDLETAYDYFDGRRDRIEREFLGFRRVVRTNADHSKVEQVFKNESVLTKGLLETERLTDVDGQRTVVETVNTWSDPIQVGLPLNACMNETPIILNPYSYCGSYFAPLDQVEKRFYEDRAAPGIVTRQRFVYDVLGDVAWFYDDGDVADPADDLKAKIAYVSSDTAATTLYSVSRPWTVEVWDGAGNLLRSRTAGYDATTGNLTSFRAEIGGGAYADTNLHWFLNGTLDWVEGPKNAAGQRYKTSYGYDPVAQIYVAAITDSHGYVSTAEYDPRFGEATRTTDVNGNVTARRLDVFGRVDRIAGPYDTLDAPTVRITYMPDAAVPYAWTRNRLPRSEADRRGSVDTVVVMDGLGRAIQTKKSAEMATSDTTKGAGWSVTGHQRYDAMGRIVEQGQTFAEFSARPEYVPGIPRNATRSVYDVLGRAIETVEPNGAVTRMTYGFGSPSGSIVTRFKTVSTDAEGRSKAAYKDASDRVVAVEERIEGRAPTTQYQFNAVGEVTRLVDASGNVTALTYDLLGRRTSLQNPDTGLTQLKLDAAGNLSRRIDANGESVSYTYDYDQLTQVTYPRSHPVAYTYGTAADAAKNGIGRIMEVKDDAGRELRTYGKLGELASMERVLRPILPGDRERSFKTSFSYDSFGRMLSITYPDGEKLAYEYDAGGLLEKATGRRPGATGGIAEEVYLRSLVYDEFGQRVRMDLGNGVKTAYAYEPLTRRLHSLTTTTPYQRTLQAITYGYDLVGNITSMVNALGEPVGDRTGETSFQYRYDDLYRLTWAHGQARAGAGTIDRYTASYAYSDIHNMQSNVQVHEVVYADPTAGLTIERPPKTNHEFAYDYTGEGPHRAKRIGDTNLVYDRNGNTVRECTDQGDPSCQLTSDRLRRFVWTEENRLDQVIDGGGRSITRFVYDAGGDRVVKLGRGGESITIGQFWTLKGRRAATKHVFAGATRLASKLLPPPGWGDQPRSGVIVVGGGDGVPNGCEPSNYQPQKCPILPGGDPSVTYPTDDTRVRPETYYYNSDHLGSTNWVTDHNALVHEHVEYFPYGEVWRDARHDADGAPLKGQRFLFTSKEMDEETGLYYFGARYLDPRRARWLSTDPALAELVDNVNAQSAGFLDPQALSHYAYARHRPTYLVDPDGRNPILLILMIAGLLAIENDQHANIGPALAPVAALPQVAAPLAVGANMYAAHKLGRSVDAAIEGKPAEAIQQAQEAQYLFAFAGITAAGGRTPSEPKSSMSFVPLFRGPASRHFANSVTQRSVAKEINTVIASGTDVAGDVAAINAGRAMRAGDRLVVNGRTYGVHPETGTLYPISGPGLQQLSRGGYKALGVYNEMGNTARAANILDRMGIGEADRMAARKAAELR